MALAFENEAACREIWKCMYKENNKKDEKEEERKVKSFVDRVIRGLAEGLYRKALSTLFLPSIFSL